MSSTAYHSKFFLSCDPRHPQDQGKVKTDKNEDT